MNAVQDKPHILVVDDDDRLRQLLAKFLGEHGFLVSACADAKEARRQMGWFAFDLMVLDVMMPGETGLALLKSLPQQHLPVLMLSALGEAQNRIDGLATGAEDYLTKPFEPQELLLRIRAILRRSAPAAMGGPVMFGEFRFDPAAGQLLKSGQPVALTGGEAALLRRLAATPGAPVARDELARALPGGSSERGVDVQITRLRKKIEESEGKPVHLQTVRGAGYVLYAEAPIPAERRGPGSGQGDQGR